MDIEAADLLEVYPDPDNPYFNKIISHKKEFADLSLKKPVKFGERFSYQEILLRLMSAKTSIKEMGVLWPTGRGKTRVALDLAETVIHHHEQYGNNINDLHILIIAPKSVIPAWRREIEKNPKFMDSAKSKLQTKSDYSTKGRQGAVTTAIKKYFDLRPQDAFASEIAKLSNEQIIARYSGRYIFIDEAHSLRNTKQTGELLRDKDGIVTDENEQGQKDRTSKKAYIQIRRLMMLVKNCVKIILTATPIPDKLQNLPSVLSFILPDDKQLSIDELEQIGLNEEGLYRYLEPRLRGRISYVPSLDDEVKIIYEGTPLRRTSNNEITAKEIKIYNCQMTNYQYQVYLDNKSENEEGEEIFAEELDFEAYDNKQTQANDKFTVRTRQALNFTFISTRETNTLGEFEYFDDPDFNNKETKKYRDGFIIITPPTILTSEQKNNKIKLKEQAAAAKEENEEKGTKAKRTKSKKVTDKKGKEHTFKLKNEETLFKGCEPRPANLKFTDRLENWVDDHGVKHEGLVHKRMQVIRRMSSKAYEVIKLVHENHKFVDEPEFTYYYHKWIKEGGGILLGICFDLIGYQRFTGSTNNAESLPDSPKYSFMMGKPGSTDWRNGNIQEVVNHPSNRFGQKVLIIIASAVTATGWSFLNARKFIHGGPDYTLYDQPLGRAKRSDSHRAFKNKEQKFVRVFLLAASTPNAEQTTDHRIWYMIAQKMAIIEIPTRVLHRIAVDCALNVASSTIGECYDTNPEAIEEVGNKYLPPPEEIDVSTYHLHWAEDEFQTLESKIRLMFKVVPILSFDDIVNSLQTQGHLPSTITWTLTRLLSREELIEDRFGFIKILRENNGVYFLADVDTTSTNGKIKTSLTDKNFDINTNKYISEISIDFSNKFNNLSIEYAQEEASYGLPNSVAKFKIQWESQANLISPDVRLIIFEDALLNRIKDKFIRNYILNDMAMVWFVYEINNETVIFHYLKEMLPKGTAKNTNNSRNELAKEKTQLRIKYSSRPGGFSDAKDNEIAMYVPLINKRWLDEEIRVYRESKVPFVGIVAVSSDRKFRIKSYNIVNNKVLGPGQEGTDKRKKAKGKDAFVSISEPILMDFLWKLKIEPPAKDESLNVESPPKTHSLLVKLILSKLIDTGKGKKGAKTASDITIDELETWSDDKLHFYFRWIGGSKMLKNKLAESIMNFLDSKGWIIRK